MTEKQEKFLELLGVKLGQKFKVEGKYFPYYFKEPKENHLILYFGKGTQCITSELFPELLTSNITPIEETILTDKEKEYLKNVCRPFKDKIEYIKKIKRISCQEEYLLIVIVNDLGVAFPNFKLGTMYKGMEYDKEYTLKELGLFEQNENANDDN